MFFFTLFGLTAVYAQPDNQDAADTYVPAPKREFRGVWIATVVNIDWPSSQRSAPETQRKELLNILNEHRQTGINAVMLQVRPAADALYAKSFEPWSKYLTGQQGRAPYPEYDPLEFAIDEAHKRGIELHAWFNPYRATFDRNFSALATDHITRLKPEWFFTYGGIKLFNPGIPEVREYIVKVILNVVDNYDVDGIHLDDYFYPYPIAGQRIDDEAAYEKCGSDFDNIKDWRRANVDSLIKMLSDSIHAHKPYVKFGISPFGIWANKNQNPEGSETNGGSSYYEQFADSRRWITEGWLDYINPQLYWQLGNRAAAFDKLLDWWSNNANNHHLYIGQGPYRILERKTAAFRNPAELPNQVKYLRNNARVQGSVYFSSNSLLANPLGFTDSLRANYYKYPALPPPMLWRDSVPPNVPRNLTIKPSVNGITLHWLEPLQARDHEPVYGYVIYRFEEGEKTDINDPKHILHIQYNNSTFYQDDTAEKGKTYLYVITAIDRLKNESDRTPAIAVSN
ncbi:glycoside hydrolase [Mucilaginibacter limnophilus]|uniref:Glycoside hydrolase n=1 Tax=Mucilaginibacter limnophilus TaxID=1932778 RepID=A0A3S2Y2R6_9SPHI|nr:glycoside hydrolase [Mucilaginibacter limnophilus]